MRASQYQTTFGGRLVFGNVALFSFAGRYLQVILRVNVTSNSLNFSYNVARNGTE